MEVKLETRHFRDAICYDHMWGCPLYLALEEMNLGEIYLGVEDCKIGNTEYCIQGAVESLDEDVDTIAYSGLLHRDVDTLIDKAKAGEEIETVIVNLIPV